jgi:hypothetical protein
MWRYLCLLCEGWPYEPPGGLTRSCCPLCQFTDVVWLGKARRSARHVPQPEAARLGARSAVQGADTRRVQRRRDTTVAAHSNWQSEGKGVGHKSHDWATVDACSACHDELDRRNRLSSDEKRLYWLEGFVRTVGDRIARGVLRVD